MALVLVGLVHPRFTGERRLEVCRSCVARRTVEEGWFWTNSITKGSRLLDETFGGHHDHTWGFCSSADYVLGGKTRVACGNPLGNPLAHLYERDDGFRAFVLRKLGDGTLRREEWLSLLELPRRPSEEETSSPGFPARADRARALVRESGLEARNEWQFSNWNRQVR